MGQAVIQLALKQGHQVVNIDQAAPKVGSPSVPFLQVNSTNYDEVKQALAGNEAIIHLAAIPAPFDNPDHQVHNNNVVSNYNVLSAAAQLGIARLCLASSVNAIGGEFSRRPRYDYFPIDEHHPTYNEDPYSLSKWISEQQADSFARRNEKMQIASLRLHWLIPNRAYAVKRLTKLSTAAVKHLWGYTQMEAGAQACLLALTAEFKGHEIFNIMAPDTTAATSSPELHQRHYPHVPLRNELQGNQSFFDCRKANRLLNWHHPLSEVEA